MSSASLRELLGKSWGLERHGATHAPEGAGSAGGQEISELNSSRRRTPNLIHTQRRSPSTIKMSSP